MFNDYLGNYAGLGIVLLIIWRAVRRGMREFFAETDLPSSARFRSP